MCTALHQQASQKQVSWPPHSSSHFFTQKSRSFRTTCFPPALHVEANEVVGPLIASAFSSGGGPYPSPARGTFQGPSMSKLAGRGMKDERELVCIGVCRFFVTFLLLVEPGNHLSCVDSPGWSCACIGGGFNGVLPSGPTPWSPHSRPQCCL